MGEAIHEAREKGGGSELMVFTITIGLNRFLEYTAKD
jgi:hypothetical protein